MRLIDADTILKADENSDKALVLGSGKTLEIAYALLKKKVADAPTIDAVPVVRCKDCARCGFCGEATNLEVMGFYGYCSRGKRKENET